MLEHSYGMLKPPEGIKTSSRTASPKREEWWLVDSGKISLYKETSATWERAVWVKEVLEIWVSWKTVMIT